jgi:hypothetical protein
VSGETWWWPCFSFFLFEWDRWLGFYGQISVNRTAPDPGDRGIWSPGGCSALPFWKLNYLHAWTRASASITTATRKARCLDQFLKCLGRFWGIFLGSMKTPENTSKHLWAIRWAGFGMFRPRETHRAGVEMKHVHPLAFLSGGWRREGDEGGRWRQRRCSKTMPPPMLEDATVAAPSNAAPASPSQVPTFFSRPHRPQPGANCQTLTDLPLQEHAGKGFCSVFGGWCFHPKHPWKHPLKHTKPLAPNKPELVNRCFFTQYRVGDQNV